MKNLTFFIIFNLLLIALVMMTSCTKANDACSGEFSLERRTETLYGKTSQIRFNTKSDTMSMADKVSDRYKNKIMYW